MLGSLKDFLTFPVRALFLFDEDRFGLTSLRTERLTCVAGEVRGQCLDMGCGPGNVFVKRFLGGKGRGVDVFRYPGLCRKDIVDPLRLPFPSGSFGTVTLIAAINHIPARHRDAELAELFRVLEPGGRIIVTMGNPAAEVLVHKLSAALNREDMDSRRGMDEDETYFMRDAEIAARLRKAGFAIGPRKVFWSQWGLNHLLIGIKPGNARLGRPALGRRPCAKAFIQTETRFYRGAQILRPCHRGQRALQVLRERQGPRRHQH